ncbi:hypothetical protein jhhlp_001678 [Lomentospora prolificans]|uniref:Uncharacterized protein n=1 Tax=Lomentospora prolificans TaxID=41688 RepID=A0A2N3NGW7_9PEZI|nr:hypothetical protein jhhlp_001678 [Lomentospora prolificans]
MNIHALSKQRSEDLWHEAVELLSDELRGSLDAQPGNHRDILEVVLFDARQKRELCLARRWKIKKRNGDVIILRDVFDKIITWTNAFKSVGDTVASIGPQWVVMPWTAISLLIKMSVTESEIFGTMIDGVETTTNILARYTIFEAVYLQRRTPATAQLRSSLVALYAAVLSFLAETCSYFGVNTGRRMLKVANPLSTGNIESLQNTIKDRQSEVDRDSQLVAMELLQHTAHNINALSSHTKTSFGSVFSILDAGVARVPSWGQQNGGEEVMRHALNTLQNPVRTSRPQSLNHDGLDMKQRKLVFDWLSPATYWLHHLSERTGRLESSGEWMFEDEEFQRWRVSSISGTLWLHGLAGSGKTKLASALIDQELKTAKARPDAAPMAYFYCSRNPAEPERANPQEVLRCIARQLCRDDPSKMVNPSLKNLHEFLKDPAPGESKLSISSTVDLILELLKENPATIIIDALDEADPLERHQLMDALDKIVLNSENIVKVFLTSRNDGDITCRLSSTPNIYIDAHRNVTDLSRYIVAEISAAVRSRKLLGGNVSERLQTTIGYSVMARAKGLFQSVNLQLQSLCDTQRIRTESDLLEQLGQLPDTLPDLYSISLAQVMNQTPSESACAVAALKLLLAALHTLPWDAFLALLSKAVAKEQPVNVSRESILRITCGFLDSDEEKSFVAFSHSSAREYLQNHRDFPHPMVHLMAASVCFASLEGASHSMPLCAAHQYSCSFLGHHLEEAGRALRQRELGEQINNFLALNPNGGHQFKVWREDVARIYFPEIIPSIMMSTRSLRCAHPLGFSIIFNLEEYFLDLMDNTIFASGVCYNLEHICSRSKVDSTVRASCYLTCNLTWFELAIQLSRAEIITTMLQKDMKPFTFYNDGGLNILHFACSLGNAKMVRTILEFEVDPNELTRQAEQEQRRPEELGRFSREHGVRSGLGFRSSSRAGDVVTPFIRGSDRSAPIHLAISAGASPACVRELLSHGADVHKRTQGGSTTLQLAVEAGDAAGDIVDILLEYGADPNATVGFGRTIVHVSAAMGLADILSRLLKSGSVDPNVPDAYGQTLFNIATRYGHENVLSVLDNMGATQQSGRLSLDSNEDDDQPSLPLMNSSVGTEWTSRGEESFPPSCIPQVTVTEVRDFNHPILDTTSVQLDNTLSIHLENTPDIQRDNTPSIQSDNTPSDQRDSSKAPYQQVEWECRPHPTQAGNHVGRRYVEFCNRTNGPICFNQASVNA